MSVIPRALGRHPSIPAVLFVCLSVAIPLLASHSLLNGDSDPARHLRHGQVILQRGDVIRSDPFSFSRPGAPFVGFEYGSQVLMAAADALGGKPGLVALAALLISTTLSLLAGWLLRQGLDPLLVVITILVTTTLSTIHWIARPHLVSWPFTVLLLFALERPTPPKAWHVALFFSLWANLHGAFVYGWLLISLYLIGNMVDARTSRSRPAGRAEAIARARSLGTLLPVAIAATFLNPYGWRLPSHVVGFFRDPYIQQTTHEFLSPNFHSPELRPFLLVLLGMVAVLAVLPRPRATRLLVMLAHIGMALVAQRNVTLFALVAVPLLAVHVGPWWATLTRRSQRLERFAATARSGRTTPYVLAGAVWLAVLAGAHGTVAGRSIVPDEFSRTTFPADAVAEARAAGLQGRLFQEFFWGGYVLYAWPETKVFIDGGTDFYGADLLKTYHAITGLQLGWRDSLKTRGIDMVLVPPRSPLAGELNLEADWTRWYCDSTAVLFTRRRPNRPAVPSRPGCAIEQDRR